MNSNPAPTEPDSYVVVLIDEVDIADTAAVVSDEFLVAGWPLVTVVRSQHALEAHADTFDSLNWRPAGRSEQIEANDSVAVDVGMHGNRAGGAGRRVTLNKLDLRGF